jgi:diadenosine tetraphosphate (Ap4A) HIT family hydrolase
LHLGLLQLAAAATIATLLAITSASALAAPIYEENFSYNAGTQLNGTGGWAAHSGAGTNPQTVGAGSLSYAGYPSSGIGNSLGPIALNGEDNNHTFPGQAAGTVYMAALVNVSSTQASGDYFLHMFDGAIAGNNFYSRIFIKKDPGTGTNYAFGVQFKSTVDAVYTPGFTFTPGTTHLVVVKYTFVPGATNDVVQLFVDPAIQKPEPAPTLTAVHDITQTDAVNMDGVAVRQGGAGSAGSAAIDGIRVATSWSDAVGAKIATATLLTAPLSSTCGDKISLTAQVSPTPDGGTVSFYDGATPITTIGVDANGMAVASVMGLAPGNHSLTAVYNGTSSYATSTSNKVSHDVAAIPTTTVLSGPPSSQCGDKVTLSAQVSPAGATGNVEFFDGATTLGVRPLDANGIATISLTSLAPGSHSFTSKYLGDACHPGSSSQKIPHTVNTDPVTVVVSGPAKVNCGDKATITATVSPVTATGNVEFFDGATTLGIRPLDANGVATLSIETLGIGDHSITANYLGDACHFPAGSNKITVTSSPLPTSVQLGASPNPAKVGTKVTLSATVNPTDQGGIVEFFDGATSLGSSVVDENGQATLSVPDFTVGDHSVTAVYSGAGCYAGSTSNKVTVTILGLPTVSIGDASGLEGSAGTSSFGFKISLSVATLNTVTVDWSTSDGSATLANNDYVAASGTATFLPGETSQTISVDVNGDLKFEGDETFHVNLSNASSATIGDGQGDGTISNDDGTPTVSIADAPAASEGNSGTKVFKFPVTLSNTSGSQILVLYSTQDGTATTANGDYQAKTDTLKIAPKAASDTIRINVVGDTRLENDETFFVNLTSAVGATIGTAQGTGTILNDDGLPQIQVTSGNTAAQGKNEGNSGKTAFPIQISLVGANALATVEADWHTEDDAATLANNDYQAASGHVTFAPKATTATITVFINGDVTREDWETLAIVLTNPVNATLRDFGFGPGVGFVTIQDDDAEPKINIGDVAVQEGNTGETNFVFSVSLTRPSSAAVSVHWTTQDGTAVGGNLPDGDYTPASGVITFGEKETKATVTVQVHGDNTIEPDETFSVRLTQPLHATIQDNTGVATIVNDDGTISIADASVMEGNAGTTDLVFKVSLSVAATEKVTVNYHTTDGTATVANNDYVAASGTLSFAPGETSQNVTVVVNGDTKLEGDETLNVVLDSASPFAIADGAGVGTIQNDDSTPVVSIADAPAATEGNSGTKVFKFPVTLSNTSGSQILVLYSTANGTATTANGDYQAKTDTLKIAPKAASDTIRINVVGDTRLENDETFFVNLTSAVGATIGTAQGTGTILNDDGLPQIQVTSGNTAAQGKNEGNSGKTAFPIQISLVGANALATVEADWHTEDDAATLANNDYQAASGHVTFAPKATTATITVFINGDVTREDWETLAIVLTNPVNATLRDFGFGPGVGFVTIQDDDAEPKISISDVMMNEGNLADGETQFVFSVSLNHPSSAAVSVHWTTLDGTAVGGNLPDGDYEPGSGVITFGEKETKAEITINVHGDDAVEDDETFQVRLTQPLHATIQDAFGLGTILNDDGGPTPTLVTQFKAEPVMGGVSLHWQLQDATQIASLSVERSENEIGPWSPVMTDQLDEGGVIGTVDRGVVAGRTYWYRLEVRDRRGNSTVIGPVQVQSGDAIASFALSKVTPNPAKFGQPVTIEYALPKAASIHVSMVDVQGRVVKVLASGMTQPGRYKVTWNGSSDQGGAVPAGLYFVRYQFAGGKAQVQRFAFTR